MEKRVFAVIAVGWIEIIAGGIAALVFMLYLVALPGMGWGLMILEPIALVTIPFMLLLAGGIGLLKQKSYGIIINGFIFPIILFLLVLFTIISKPIYDSSSAFHGKSVSLLGRLLFDATLIPEMLSHFSYITACLCLLIAVVYYVGYHIAKKEIIKDRKTVCTDG